MRKVQIITDSCSDLGRDIREKYGIDYAKMSIVMQGEEKPASLDWDLYTPEELYGVMREGERVTTTQVPAGEFQRIFTEYLDKEYDIVYIGCALPLSGSVNTGAVVAGQLKDKYPDAQIFSIDATNSCLGEGLLAVRAAELRDQGLSASEIAAEIEKEKHNVNQFVTVNSLDALRRAGRVKASSAFFGNLFGVKPIIISDKIGQNIAVKKVKGRAASIDELVNLIKEAMTDPANTTVFVGHSDCEAEGRALCEKVKSETGCKDVYFNVIGPIIGASIGPDALAVFAMGKPVETVG